MRQPSPSLHANNADRCVLCPIIRSSETRRPLLLLGNYYLMPRQLFRPRRGLTNRHVRVSTTTPIRLPRAELHPAGSLGDECDWLEARRPRFGGSSEVARDGTCMYHGHFRAFDAPRREASLFFPLRQGTGMTWQPDNLRFKPSEDIDKGAQHRDV